MTIYIKLFILGLFFLSNLSTYTMADKAIEINRVTQGQGVFQLTAHNTTEYPLMLSATLSAYALNEGYRTSELEDTEIPPHSSKILIITKPLFGKWPNYQGEGPTLMGNMSIFINFGGKIFQESYPQKYVKGTKFVHVKDLMVSTEE